MTADVDTHTGRWSCPVASCDYGVSVSGSQEFVRESAAAIAVLVLIDYHLPKAHRDDPIARRFALRYQGAVAAAFPPASVAAFEDRP